MRRPLLVIALTALAALTVVSVPFFILYDDDRVAKADAVMVFGLPLAIALEWAKLGVATVGRQC